MRRQLLLLLSRMKPIEGLVGVGMVHWRRRFPGRHRLHWHSEVSHVGSQLHASHVGDETNAMSRKSRRASLSTRTRRKKEKKKEGGKKKNKIRIIQSTGLAANESG